MGKTWPALDVTGDHDLILAAADDYSPTAVEERDTTLRIFFTTADTRDRAASALAPRFTVSSIDVDDQDWARKQELAPIAVGNIPVFPEPRAANPDRINIIIPHSMGFGTGHHATTRLCLAALQSIDLRGKFVLDVGTGSGLLAIAAVKLGAARALGIDDDADAIQAANENLGLNNVTNVEFLVSDAASFVTNLLRRARRDIPRSKVPETRILSLEVVVAFSLWNQLRGAGVALPLRHPDPTVIAQRFRHKG